MKNIHHTASNTMAFRKDGGKFYRKVSCEEFKQYFSFVHNRQGKQQLTLFPSDEVIAITINGKELSTNTDARINFAELEEPLTVEFAYSVKHMNRKYGQRKNNKKSPKLSLTEFAKLFDSKSAKKEPEEPIIDANLEVHFPKALLHEIEQDAHQFCEEQSRNFCACKKKKLLDNLHVKEDIVQLDNTLLRESIMSYRSSINLICDYILQNQLCTPEELLYKLTSIRQNAATCKKSE